MGKRRSTEVFNAASSSDSTMTVDEDGDKHWKNAKGQLHRLDGPAYEGADGTKQWCINHKLHRLDGPAIEWADGVREWYIDDKELTETEFNKHPAVLEFQHRRQAETKAAEEASRKENLENMHRIMGPILRNLHAKRRGPK